MNFLSFPTDVADSDLCFGVYVRLLVMCRPDVCFPEHLKLLENVCQIGTSVMFLASHSKVVAIFLL